MTLVKQFQSTQPKQVETGITGLLSAEDTNFNPLNLNRLRQNGIGLPHTD